jgi:hypothetical protein
MRAKDWDLIRAEPAAIRAASTGRTHDRTRPMLHQRKKALVNQAPSTHDPKADISLVEIPQCSRHICELLFLIFVLGLNLLLLLHDWPLWLKRMGQRRTALRVIVRQSLPNLRHL